MLQKQLDTNVRLTTLVERLGNRIEVLEAMDEGSEGQEAFVPPVEPSEITAEGNILPWPESSTWTPPVVDSTPVQAFGSPLPSPESSTVNMGSTQGLMSTLPIGQLKLEAPPRFNGARRLGAQTWLESMTTWMTLMNYPWGQWILISSTGWRVMSPLGSLPKCKVYNRGRECNVCLGNNTVKS